MKILITESKLEQVIFKYLDDKKFFIRETNDNYYFLENEGGEYALIIVTKNESDCIIYYGLFEELESFFSIDRGKSKYVLTKYVENTLNIKVTRSLPLYGVYYLDI